MKWEEITVETIIGGKFPDGSRYLKQFLTEYAAMFNVQNLCASCNNLISEYHKKYIIKIMEKSNDCQYRLLEKYNNISLGFGSSVYVNNGNITDAYGEILFKNRGASIFSQLPTKKINAIETIVEPAQTETKRKRTKKQ